MERYHDKVKTVCNTCNNEYITTMYYGDNEKYPDDFVWECGNCSNTDEGTQPQAFVVLEDYGRFETTEGKVCEW
ncbi:MAG: hypothetical protein WD512_02910 [Candidatus Paceibacterota bacterium]